MRRRAYAEIGQLTVERDFWPGGQVDERARSKKRWSNGLARTCRCAADARLWASALGGLPPKPVARADDLAVMRRIDELRVELPFTARGEWRRTRQGRPWGQPQASAAADAGDRDRSAGSPPRHEQSRARAQECPYLLRGLENVEPNHVSAADMTCIPMACGFLYLVAIIDSASRAVLAWRLSNTNAGFSGLMVERDETQNQRYGSPYCLPRSQRPPVPCAGRRVNHGG